MNVWHDIKIERITPNKFVAVVEIEKQSKNKYELDKETGLLMLDRILHTSTHYPANYGFIPKTLAEDNDPLDVLILCSEAIKPLCMVECYPIGVISMSDGGVGDDKIIAIPFNDPNWNFYQDLTDLPKHLIEEIMHFSVSCDSFSPTLSTFQSKITPILFLCIVSTKSFSPSGRPYLEDGANISFSLFSVTPTRLTWVYPISETYPARQAATSL